MTAENAAPESAAELVSQHDTKTQEINAAVQRELFCVASAADSSLSTGAPKELDRSHKVGNPIDFANARQSRARTAHLWPDEFENGKKTTRSWLLALREYINNTYQSLLETQELGEATITFKFNLEYKGDCLDWENSSLVISDTAGGMDAERLAEALQLNCEQTYTAARAGGNYADVSLNRHGCGLKSSTVQLARFMSSVKYIATRKIGAAAGYGFMYYDDSVPGKGSSTQIYEDNNIFPPGTHGTEIHIKGLSNVWPDNKQFGGALYREKTHKNGDIGFETTSSTVLGQMAQHLGFYYSWWLSGRLLKSAPPPHNKAEFRTWCEAGYKIVRDEKRLHIVIEVWEKNWTHRVGTHNVLPLFVAWDPNFPPPQALPVEVSHDESDGSKSVRAGTILLGRAKAAAAYTYRDGPAPGQGDLRIRQQKPFFHLLKGLHLFEPAEAGFTAFRSISNSSAFVQWAGCVFDAVGFCTNTEKTGVIIDTRTMAFYDLVAVKVKEQVDRWTKEHAEELDKRKEKTSEIEAAYRDAYVADLNKPDPMGGKKLAQPEQPLRARVLPAANDIVERLQEIFAGIGLPADLYAAIPWDRLTVWVENNIAETAAWLEARVNMALIGDSDVEQGDRELKVVADEYMRAYRGEPVIVGRADVLVQRDLLKEPVSSMSPEERNAARKLSNELKARFATATHVFQLLDYMLVPKETDSVKGNLLARSFTVGSLAAACFLRALGFKIDLLSYESIGLEIDNPLPPRNEREDDTLDISDRGEPALTLMSLADRRALAKSFDEIGKDLSEDAAKPKTGRKRSTPKNSAKKKKEHPPVSADSGPRLF